MALNLAGRLVARLIGLEEAHAHCDVPCGIYDPHAAQIAALTVVRMNQLIEGSCRPEMTRPRRTLWRVTSPPKRIIRSS